jgi:beta-glucosidase
MFPKDFIWSAATAGHQVEGNNTNSDCWFLENVTPTIFKEPSGKACNSYELWQTDIDLAKGLNLNAYRFSIEWARIEPVEGTFDEKELAHYETIIDYCIANRLEPIVTLNHFVNPHWFAMKGGWLAEDSAERFARYCGFITSRLGSKLKRVVTLNEPNLPHALSWIHLPEFVNDLTRKTLVAAAEATGVQSYKSANVVAPEDVVIIEDGLEKGHRAARIEIKKQAPHLQVGLSIAIIDDRVEGNDATLRDRKRAECYGRWLEVAKTDDFIGVQNYEAATYNGTEEVVPPADAPRNGMGQPIDPTSLAGCVAYAHEVTGKPVFITEHGVNAEDDAIRQSFMPASLVELEKLVAAGVPVLGYTHWSLLDNFEWIFGYGPKFGLFSVDRETFVRSPKPSSAIYAQIAKNNTALNS